MLEDTRTKESKRLDSSEMGKNANWRNFEISAATSVGKVRDNNEDSCDMFPIDTGEAFVLILADGMGGHTNGQLASRLAVKTIREALIGRGHEELADALLEGIVEANKQVYDFSQNSAGGATIGTTIVCALLGQRKAVVASVGDSRAYLISDSSIEQITTDHSWVAEQVRDGLLSPEEAESKAFRHIITRAVGAAKTIEVDIFEKAVNRGDTILLCSDGLTNLVSNEEILAYVKEAQEEQNLAKGLVDKANEYGGNDNTTVLAAKMVRWIHMDWLI